MICVRLEGGLGNQLFQHAAGRVLSLRHQVPLVWDLDLLLRPPAGVTPRPFELDRFRVQGRAAAPGEVRFMRWLSRLGPASRVLSPWRSHRERPGGYDRAFDRLADGTYLAGYWQSWRYFQAHAALLADEFAPAGALSPRSAAVLQSLAGAPCAALHVRRGDYVHLASAARFHGALPLSYYVEALARLERLAARPALLVFSDDPEWCRAHLPLDGWQAVFVAHNQGADAWQDLVLMAACRHHVIANSSFSWWGAWLADQRQGREARCVVAPAQWFAAVPVSPADRFPPHWQVLGTPG